MSKLTKTIMLCECRPITIELERIAMIRYDDGKVDIYKVPDSKMIKTKKGEIFFYNDDYAIPSGNSAICYFDYREINALIPENYKRVEK